MISRLDFEQLQPFVQSYGALLAVRDAVRRTQSGPLDDAVKRIAQWLEQGPFPLDDIRAAVEPTTSEPPPVGTTAAAIVELIDSLSPENAQHASEAITLAATAILGRPIVHWHEGSEYLEPWWKNLRTRFLAQQEGRQVGSSQATDPPLTPAQLRDEFHWAMERLARGQRTITPAAYLKMLNPFEGLPEPFPTFRDIYEYHPRGEAEYQIGAGSHALARAFQGQVKGMSHVLARQIVLETVLMAYSVWDNWARNSILGTEMDAYRWADRTDRVIRVLEDCASGSSRPFRNLGDELVAIGDEMVRAFQLRTRPDIDTGAGIAAQRAEQALFCLRSSINAICGRSWKAVDLNDFVTRILPYAAQTFMDGNLRDGFVMEAPTHARIWTFSNSPEAIEERKRERERHLDNPFVVSDNPGVTRFLRRWWLRIYPLLFNFRSSMEALPTVGMQVRASLAAIEMVRPSLDEALHNLHERRDQGEYAQGYISYVQSVDRYIRDWLRGNTGERPPAAVTSTTQLRSVAHDLWANATGDMQVYREAISALFAYHSLGNTVHQFQTYYVPPAHEIATTTRPSDIQGFIEALGGPPAIIAHAKAGYVVEHWENEGLYTEAVRFLPGIPSDTLARDSERRRKLVQAYAAWWRRVKGLFPVRDFEGEYSYGGSGAPSLGPTLEAEDESPTETPPE